MIDIREMLNISYFDNKELSLKEHCDIYSNIKKELISILNKYDIKYVIADTESIRDLSSENQKLKKQLEEKENKYTPGEYAKNEYIKTFDENILLKNQQKEFIEWLEDKEKQFDVIGDPINSGACLGILRKYKEIIGSDINDGSKGDDK